MTIIQKECPYCGRVIPMDYVPIHTRNPRIIYTQRCPLCGEKFIVNGFVHPKMDQTIKHVEW